MEALLYATLDIDALAAGSRLKKNRLEQATPGEKEETNLKRPNT